MRLFAIGCSYKTTHVDLREKLAFDGEKYPRALEELERRFECEAVILSTCNRVEMYLAQVIDQHSPRETLDAERATEFLAEFHGLASEELRSHLYIHEHADAVRHLFKVVASLDSMVLGEGQIAGQVKTAYEQASACNSVGQVFHILFQHAREVAKRVRNETRIAKGRVSISSVGVDFIRQVFDTFDDKTVLVIGAGKMGELTLRHLRELHPGRILVTNRSPEKAKSVAAECGGHPVPWENLDASLVEADIVLSTTGAPEPIVTLDRHRQMWKQRKAKRGNVMMAILDISVPRDFDPAIHDGDRTILFNIDDLERVRDETLKERFKEVSAAETIIDDEVRRFLKKWSERKTGPLIARLTQDFEAKRKAIVDKLKTKLNGRLTEADLEHIEGAFRLLQNQFLHGPKRALTEEGQAEDEESGGTSLLDAFLKLFHLKE